MDGIRALNRQAFEGETEAEGGGIAARNAGGISSRWSPWRMVRWSGRCCSRRSASRPLLHLRGSGWRRWRFSHLVCQNLGIGTQLGHKGLALCSELGYDFAVVLGHTDYYPRFGSKKPATSASATITKWTICFMALEFKPGVLGSFKGVAHYAPEFSEQGS